MEKKNTPIFLSPLKKEQSKSRKKKNKTEKQHHNQVGFILECKTG